MTTKEKKEAERRQTCSANLRAFKGAARVQRHALAYRRSTAVLNPSGLIGPWAQLQARLPWDAAGRSICKAAPTGKQKVERCYAGVTRARLSQSRDAPPGPVVVPVSMMPEAARMRSVSLRARAPHSLTPPKSTLGRRRPRLSEIRSCIITEMRTTSQRKSYVRASRI